VISYHVMLDVPIPGGAPLWVSGVLPGRTHDVTAARELVRPQARPA
jgi:hypothetical protein